MTDKQIIFDDVDVKDCIAYAKLQEIYLGNTLYKQMDKVCMVKNMPCKYFDCQFKQMARELKVKEQECEELKKQWEFSVTHKMILEKDYIAELDQLKAENEKYQLFIEKLCDYTGLECDNEEQAMRTLPDFASQMNKARWRIDRYKQTLTEIKEFFNEECIICKENYINITGEICEECKYQDILRKINEVEDENL